MRTILVATLVGAVTVTAALEMSAPAWAREKPEQPRKVRDILWVWGNPEMAKGSDAEHTYATYAESSPARRAELLGASNILMCGNGLPDDPKIARAQTEPLKHAPHLVWKIYPDGGDAGDYSGTFEYTRRASRIPPLKAAFSRFEAVLLDDMTSVAVSKGFKPEHIRALKTLLAAQKQPVDLWGVVYTMNFGIAGLDRYVDELDVINLWTWDAKDLVDLEKNLIHCEKNFPGKPIVLGLYLYDYGNAGGQPQPMPRDLLKLQCETALKLALEGRIAGIAFLTITNDAEAVQWTAEWIKRVGEQPLRGS